MKSIQQAMLEEIYQDAIVLSHENKQLIDEKNDFYVTIEQLEAILKGFED
jgi:hypothetical protein